MYTVHRVDRESPLAVAGSDAPTSTSLDAPSSVCARGASVEQSRCVVLAQVRQVMLRYCERVSNYNRRKSVIDRARVVRNFLGRGHLGHRAHRVGRGIAFSRKFLLYLFGRRGFLARSQSHDSPLVSRARDTSGRVTIESQSHMMPKKNRGFTVTRRGVCTVFYLFTLHSLYSHTHSRESERDTHASTFNRSQNTDALNTSAVRNSTA